LFERFYRVDKARSRGTGGTGLGLSIVEKIVAVHGGYMEVKSEAGKGSTFTAHFPLGSTQMGGGEEA
ncbi:MAG: two-component sensor histidine kinase, partial [Clostridia bacterium]|nr:two-component sensor histidine kinase [Clostridia bacterium]